VNRAQAFVPAYSEMPLFVDTYQGLRREGLPFSGDGSKPFVFTPPAKPSDAAGSDPTAAHAFEREDAALTAALRATVLADADGNFDVLAARATSAAAALRAAAGKPSDDATRLLGRCAEARAEISAALVLAAEDGAVALLAANDELNSAIGAHGLGPVEAAVDLLDTPATSDAGPADPGPRSVAPSSSAAEEPSPFLGLVMPPVPTTPPKLIEATSSSDRAAGSAPGNPFDSMVDAHGPTPGPSTDPFADLKW